MNPDRDPPGVDATSHVRLVRHAYPDDRHLSARQSLYRWQEPRYDLPGIVLREIAGATGIAVDVGCGNGQYVTRLRRERPDLTVVGLDLSSGILADIAPPLVIADAARLPFASGAADVVLAMHMIYHLPDVAAGVAELARVLRPGGVLLASTNARDDKRELDELWAAAAGDVLGVPQGPRRASLSSRFPLDESPALLRRHFGSVRMIELPGTITVTEPAPVVAHLGSYRAWADQVGVPFDDTLERVRQRLVSLLRHRGEFTITCRGGILVCRDPVMPE